MGHWEDRARPPTKENAASQAGSYGCVVVQAIWKMLVDAIMRGSTFSERLEVYSASPEVNLTCTS